MSASILIFMNIVSFVSGFKALGTDPPAKCDTTKSDCPSHYICEGGYDEEAKYGNCRCDRFYGFYGPTCEKLSITSYVYAITLCLFLSISLIAISYMICLLRLLYVKHKLSSAILTTLLINMMAPFISIYFTLEYILTTFGIDKRMFMRANLRMPFILMAFFPLILGSVQVSGNWIRHTQNLRERNVYCNRYNFIIFIIFLTFTLLVTQAIFSYHATESVVVMAPFLVGLSYWYGGTLVVKALRSMYIPGMEISGTIKHALELAYGIERTYVNIIILCFFSVVSSLITMFTYHSKHSYYKGQNHLPRWAQGQIGCFMQLFCLLGTSHQVTQYFHFICLRHDMKYVPLKYIYKKTSIEKKKELKKKSSFFMLFLHQCCIHCYSFLIILWNMFTPQDDIEADVNMFLNYVDDEEYDGPSSLSSLKQHNTTSYGSKLIIPPIKRRNSYKQIHPIVTILTTNIPLALVTFNKINNQIISKQVVIDHESGNLVDFLPSEEKKSVDEEKGEKDDENNTYNVLSAGSHAFIRCTNESHLRCSMDSFEFGHVTTYQHECLCGPNNVNQILMAGELEVDDKGILTRWLNKSDLYSVPRHVTGRAGLPFHLSWLYISQSEYETMDVEKRQILEESQCLIEIPPLEMSSISTSYSVSSASEHPGNIGKEKGNSISSFPNKPSSTSSSSSSSIPKLSSQDEDSNITSGQVGYIIKADQDFICQPKISYKVYKEAQKRIHHFKETVKSLLLKTSNNKVELIMKDDEIIHLAVNRVVEDGLDPDCNAYFKDKKMIFDMREDEEEEKRKILETINEMKRQMTEAGVFDTHRKGNEERRKWQAELGY